MRFGHWRPYGERDLAGEQVSRGRLDAAAVAWLGDALEEGPQQYGLPVTA